MYRTKGTVEQLVNINDRFHWSLCGSLMWPWHVLFLPV